MQRPLLRTTLVALAISGALGPPAVRAEHFTGYSITYEWTGINNAYDVYLDLYMDCAGTGLTFSHQLQFDRDCGPSFTLGGTTFPLDLVFSVEVSPVCASEVGSSTCNGGSLPGYRWHRLKKRVNLTPCDSWRISWRECCRHESVNLLNGFTPGMYAGVVLNNSGGHDRSPVFVDAGVPHMCVNEPASYNPGATDPDGNTMVFSLISARAGTPDPVDLTYEPGYSGGLPIPGISINPSSGQLNFTPTVAGMYVVVIQVATYTPGGQFISSVMRDLMFVVMPCDESAPYSAGFSQVPVGLLTGPNSIAACEGISFCVQLTFFDTNPTETIEVTSNAETLLPTSSFDVTGSNPAIATFCWTGNTSMLPVNVHVEANDGSCPIPNVSSRSIFITDCTLLPIELLTFSATPDRSKVRVEWATASEEGNAYFDIERGRTPEAMHSIARIEGAGSSQQSQHYLLHDSEPLPGLSYYRLKQTDHDGAYSYSEVVPVSFAPGGLVRVSSDGTGSGWSVASDVGLSGTWTIVDMLGRTVATGKVGGTTTILEIPAPTRTNGIMILLIGSETGDHRVKLPPLSGMGSVSER